MKSERYISTFSYLYKCSPIFIHFLTALILFIVFSTRALKEFVNVHWQQHANLEICISTGLFRGF